MNSLKWSTGAKKVSSTSHNIIQKHFHNHLQIVTLHQNRKLRHETILAWNLIFGWPPWNMLPLAMWPYISVFCVRFVIKDALALPPQPHRSEETLSFWERMATLTLPEMARYWWSEETASRTSLHVGPSSNWRVPAFGGCQKGASCSRQTIRTA